MSKIPSDHISKPLLKARLSDKQWDSVMFINQALIQEYECRREMLLKRFDVTIQSFRWSERAKVCEVDCVIYIKHLIYVLLTLDSVKIFFEGGGGF